MMIHYPVLLMRDYDYISQRTEGVSIHILTFPLKHLLLFLRFRRKTLDDDRLSISAYERL